MLEWANEELAVFQGQLAFLKLGSARICTGHRARELPNDVTQEYIALIEHFIAEWTALMALHNIPVHSPMHELQSQRAALSGVGHFGSKTNFARMVENIFAAATVGLTTTESTGQQDEAGFAITQL
jgi:hypothetical protein